MRSGRLEGSNSNKVISIHYSLTHLLTHSLTCRHTGLVRESVPSIRGKGAGGARPRAGIGEHEEHHEITQFQGQKRAQ